MRTAMAGVAAAGLVLCAGAARAQQSFGAVRVASGLTRPVFVTAPPGDRTRLFIVEQRGSGGVASQAYVKIMNLPSNTIEATPFLTVGNLPTNTQTNSEQGLLGPQHVLPLIEDAELEVEVGEWVLRQALAQMRQWTDAGMLWEVSVNISAPHFHRANFVERLKDILHTCPEVSPTRLELEILESAALQDMQYMRHMMQSCQALGVRFALDDFGTGFSSLSYLKRLPAETIKIDQSFVRGILEDGDDLTLVSAIVALAAAFHRHVVAEGVETAEQCAKLLELGCERAQGFGIARPMPAHEVLTWAREHAARHAARAVQEAARRPAST